MQDAANLRHCLVFNGRQRWYRRARLTFSGRALFLLSTTQAEAVIPPEAILRIGRHAARVLGAVGRFFCRLATIDIAILEGG